MLEFIRNLDKKRRRYVEFLDLVERGEDALRQLDVLNEREWGISNAHRTLDQAAGLVSFVTLDGRVVTARAHLIGALSAGSHVWHWAWDMPSFSPKLTELAERVKRHGEERHFERLTTARFVATPVEAWGMTAAACSLARGRGAFSEAVAGGLLFFVFSELAIAHRKPDQSELYLEQGSPK